MNINLNVPQTLAYQQIQPGKTVCTPWGRGVGKSHFQEIVWLTLIAQWDGKEREGCPGLKGIRIVLLAPTFKQTVDVHGKTLESKILGPWKFLGGTINRTRWRIEFPGGSWIQFFGAENADAARGIRVDMVTIDECDDVDLSVYESVVQPWLSEKWSLNMILVGGTPRRGRQGILYKMHERGYILKQPNHWSLHATYKDAPEIINQETVEEQKKLMSPDTFAREWLCSFDSGEGLVYPFFDQKFHVRHVLDDQYSEILIGADHGFEDPGVILILGVRGNGNDAQCHVLQEIYAKHKDPTWWADKVTEVLREYPRAKWYCDPSRADIISSWRKRGANIQQTDNSIDEGVAAVSDRLFIRTYPSGNKYSKLYVSPTCTNLIKEFHLYRRKRNPRNQQEVLDSIEDRDNHTMDALRYAIYSRFSVPQVRRELYHLPPG